MKRIFFFAAAAFSGIVAFAQNPISPAGVYIADPTGRVNPDGKMYVYGSLDVTPGRYCSKDYHVLSSENLRDWTLYEKSFTNDMDLYAPDMIHKEGTYYLYYDTPRGDEWVATSDSPTGPFKDGVKIEGPRQIDPNVFIDDDGQAYYFWGQFSAKGAKMNPDMKTIDPTTVKDGIVTESEHYFHEGSFVFKRNGWYYFVYADISRKNTPTCIGYAMSRNVMGPYEYKGVIVDNDGCNPGNWNNHGSVVEYDGQWYVLYHRSTHGCNTMRKACIEPIFFNEDGTIREAEMTSQGAAGPLDAFGQIDAARACLLNGNVRIVLSQDREILSEVRSGDSAGWKYLDFGKGTSKVHIRVRTKAEASLSLSIDQPWNRGVARISVPDTNGEWQIISADTGSIEGVHALWMSVMSRSGINDLFEIDWIKFE